jgi:hypothetical protein
MRKKDRLEEIEILKAEIENVRANQYITAHEKELKIKQIEKLINDN